MLSYCASGKVCSEVWPESSPFLTNTCESERQRAREQESEREKRVSVCAGAWRAYLQPKTSHKHARARARTHTHTHMHHCVRASTTHHGRCTGRTRRFLRQSLDTCGARRRCGWRGRCHLPQKQFHLCEIRASCASLHVCVCLCLCE